MNNHGNVFSRTSPEMWAILSGTAVLAGLFLTLYQIGISPIEKDVSDVKDNLKELVKTHEARYAEFTEFRGAMNERTSTKGGKQ